MKKYLIISLLVMCIGCLPKRDFGKAIYCDNQLFLQESLNKIAVCDIDPDLSIKPMSKAINTHPNRYIFCHNKIIFIHSTDGPLYCVRNGVEVIYKNANDKLGYFSDGSSLFEINTERKTIICIEGPKVGTSINITYNQLEQNIKSFPATAKSIDGAIYIFDSGNDNLIKTVNNSVIITPLPKGDIFSDFDIIENQVYLLSVDGRTIYHSGLEDGRFQKTVLPIKRGTSFVRVGNATYVFDAKACRLIKVG